MKIYDCWSSVKCGYNEVYDVVSKKNYRCFTVHSGLYSAKAARILDSFLRWLSSHYSFYSAAALWSMSDKSCILDKCNTGFIRRNSNGELIFKLAITTWDKDVIHDYQCNAFILNAAWQYFKLPTQLFIDNVTKEEATAVWYVLQDKENPDNADICERIKGFVFNPFLETTFKDLDKEFEEYRKYEISYFGATDYDRRHILWHLCEENYKVTSPKCYDLYQKILEVE